MRSDLSVAFTLIFLLLASPRLAASQSRATPPVVALPNGKVSRIPSPDGRWTLIFQCPNDCSERKLWVEETSSHSRRLVKEYERGLDISWAPDSSTFFVNDNSGSTDARCYVYEAASLTEIDVAKVVLARYPDAAPFLNSGHSYLRAKRWLNSHELLVVLTGHNDGASPRAFTVRYQVGLSGTVHKLCVYQSSPNLKTMTGGTSSADPKIAKAIRQFPAKRATRSAIPA